MALFMQGELSIPQDVWPLVSRSHDLAAISASDHMTSDLYVVEFASAKEVTIDGISIQLNYLNSVYSDFFSDAERAQGFWACAQNDDEPAMFEFLDQQWSDTDEQCAQAETLGKIRLNFVTRESLRRNIKKLTRILPNVLFVTHIDACKPDGRTINSRSDFIKLVGEEVSKAGCQLYNPTDLMAEFGQTAAIEDESTGLAHFTKAFSDAVMDDWMRHFIAPKTDSAVQIGSKDALDQQFQPQIAAAMRNGRFADACARLTARPSEANYVKRLLEQTILDQEAAQKRFSDEMLATSADELDAAARNQLVLTAGAHGLFEAALDLASGADGGLKSMQASTLIRTGLQAKEAGDTDNAFEFFLAAVCQNKNLSRASSALAELAVDEETDVLAGLKPEQFTIVLSHLNLEQKIRLLELHGTPFTAAVSDTSTAQDVAELVSYLAIHHGIEISAEILAFWRDQQKIDRIRDKTLVGILDQWLEAALDTAEPVDRIHGVNAVLLADPRHGGARNAARDIRQQLVLQIREAGKDGNIDALDALTLEATALNTKLPELDLWRARLRFGLGEYGAALEFGQSAAAALPETINVWVLLMRAATKAKDEAKATEFALKVIELACDETEKLKSEAETLLQTRLVGV